MWLVVAYIVGVIAFGVALSGLLCVPCCWRLCWPRGQPLPFKNRSWTIYFPLLGFVLLWWATTTTLWFYYSPISTCSPLWMRSGPPDRQATSMTHWEGFWCTRACGEESILHPTTVQEVSTALAAAGGGMGGDGGCTMGGGGGGGAGGGPGGGAGGGGAVR